LLDVDEILTFENSSLPPAPKERNRFDKNWDDFLKSDPCNEKIFEQKGKGQNINPSN